MSAINILLQRNAAFAEQRFTPNLPLATTLGITVIGCVDPRVDPAHVLGLELGEAGVLRNIGGRVTPAALQMLTLLGTLPRLLGAPRPTGGMHLVVLQHTDCGITRLAREPDRLAPYFGVAPDELDAKAVLNPYAAVQVDVAALKQAVSALPEGSTVTGLVYDVATGRVEIVAPTTSLGDAGRSAGETPVLRAGADTPSRATE
ncbi:MAG: carbonic anhydrase [Ktedonobacterales bacterium]